MKGIYEANRDISSKVLISENKNNTYHKHFHRNIELIYVKDGEMHAIIDNAQYIYKKDEIAFIHNFYSHEFSTPEESNVLVFLIPYELMGDFNTILSKQTLPIKMDDHEFNSKILSVLKLMLKLRDTNNQHTQKGYISIILGLLVSNYDLIKVKNVESTDIIIELLMYIETHYAEDISLDLLATHFGYTKNYLSHLLEAHTKSNFRDYLNTTRIQHIISIYRQEKYSSFIDIAYRCGFTNSQTFYRAFKKLYGIPPGEFFEKHLYDSIEHARQNYKPE